MGQTEQEYNERNGDYGQERREEHRIEWEEFAGIQHGVVYYPNETTCEMCGKDNGAVLRSDGHYRCSHCDLVWNG